MPRSVANARLDALIPQSRIDDLISGEQTEVAVSLFGRVIGNVYFRAQIFFDGYEQQFSVAVTRNSTNTAIGTNVGNIDVSSGRYWRLEVIANVIKVYSSTNGSTWAQRWSGTNSNVVAAGDWYTDPPAYESAFAEVVDTVTAAQMTSASSMDNVVLEGEFPDEQTWPVTLAYTATLTVAQMTSATRTDTTVLTQRHLLAAQGTTSASRMDEPILRVFTGDVQEWPVTLAIGTTTVNADAMTSATTADNTVLQQWVEYDVVARPLATLAVAGTTSATTMDTPTVRVDVVLTVQGTTSATRADNVVLTQNHLLAVAGTTSATTMDAPTIAVEDSTRLIVAGLSSATFTEGGIAIGQTHVITAAELVSASSMDTTVVRIDRQVIANELISVTTVDQLVLAQRHLLTVQGLMNITSVDEPRFPSTWEQVEVPSSTWTQRDTSTTTWVRR